ncbi:MAG: dihydropteroate synthase [Solirubrobacteraceae bacterium]|nr:dihydropteroate synthase [Solirubrobacteraceae bacterium]
MTGAGPLTLRIPGRELSLLPGRPLVMGIVNAGSDSFSDAVRHASLGQRFDHAMGLVADGADLIDVGGESGVTYTAPTAPDVEIELVAPLVARLVAEGVIVSVDTWKPEVAGAAVEAGAGILNDVSGLADVGLADVAARSGCALVLMHTRARPKQVSFPDYGGRVVEDVESFLADRIELACSRGVDFGQLIVDPGPDFAKTPSESADVLRSLARLRRLGRPVLLPVSRKYVIGAITGRPPHERLAGTLAALGHGVAAGASIVRVHDVAAAVDYLAVRRVLDGLDPFPDFDGDDERLKWIRAR